MERAITIVMISTSSSSTSTTIPVSRSEFLRALLQRVGLRRGRSQFTAEARFASRQA